MFAGTFSVLVRLWPGRFAVQIKRNAGRGGRRGGFLSARERSWTWREVDLLGIHRREQNLWLQ